MTLDWTILVPLVLGLYFLGFGVYAIARRRMPVSMTRGLRTSIEWRTGRQAILLGVIALVLGSGFILYAMAR